MKRRLIFITLALSLTLSLCLFSGCGVEPIQPSTSNSSDSSITNCEHDFGNWEVSVSASCKQEGKLQRICDKCGKIERSSIAKTQHVTEIIPATDATCYSTGSTAGAKCSVCGEILVAPQPIDKLEHNYSDWITDKEANCTNLGSKHKVCQNVGCTDKVDEEIPVLGHDFELGVCTRCSALNHNYGSQGLEYTLNDNSESYSVTGIGTCTDTNVVIPSVYNEKPVTSIGSQAFNYCYDLTNITISNSVTSIGNYAFLWCSGLTSITIPDSVIFIGKSAFSGCDRLTSITIPDSVISIGSEAFDYYRNLQFNEYDNAKYLGNDKNPYHALIFVTNTNYSSYSIHSNTKVIADEAFKGCESLTSITIPNSVTSIGKNAFENCSVLTNITISDSVTSIGENAFENCSALTNITIPDSITSIGIYAFEGCDNLQYSEYDNALYLGNEDNPYLALVKAKDKSITSCLINDKTKFICYCAFEYCNDLTSIIIPDNVTLIGNRAFLCCNKLTSVIIGKNVTSIGDQAFWDCSELTNVTIGNSVTSINFWAFYNCTKLTSVTIPDGVTSIGEGAFSQCSNLTSITIPDSVTSIGEYAFSGYSSNLKSITVAEGNKKYHSKNNCLIETESKTLILGCKNSFIPDDVTSIGDEAFSGCSGLTSITIPNSVTSIGSSAFYECSGLTSITIPDSVTSIGNNAFYYCYGLKEIKFGGTKEQWNAIEKGSLNFGVPATKVVCTDGEVEL